jgi:crotonobetainyl-CoA:carnitine CoA-transferase CaiB-like acyl-CoA transferase
VSAEGYRPLAGVSVLELGSGVAVAVSGMVLASFGATVTRLETAADKPVRSPQSELVYNREKRIVRVTADEQLATAGDPRGYDVVITGPEWGRFVDQSVRPPAALPTNWIHIGAGPVCVQNELHPADGILADAAYGLMYQQQGHREGPYCLSEPLAAQVAGLMAAAGAAAALLLRETSGTPRFVETTYADGALGALSLSAAFPLQREAPMERYRDPYSVAMSPAIRFYQAIDGWVVIASLTYQQWRNLIGLAGDQELVEEPRLIGVPSLSITDGRLAARVCDSVAGWVSARTRDEVLARCTELDLIAVPVLSHAEFLVHPQCVDNNLYVDIEGPAGPVRIAGNFVEWQQYPGEAEPIARPMADGLASLQVLDFAAYIAGPNGSRMMADLGVPVTKIEPPGGDPWRYMGYSFAPVNRGKRSVSLDLKAPGADALLQRLLQAADVVVSNMRISAERRCGLGSTELAAHHPHIVRNHITGLGVHGPYSRRPAIDVAGQALAGGSLAQGGGTEPIGFTGGSLDSALGWLSTVSVLSALFHRLNTAKGVSMECGLLHCAAFFQARSLVSPPLPGEPIVDPERYGFSAWERLYRARDGWVCLALPDDEQRLALTTSFGVDPAADDSVEGELASAIAAAVEKLDIGSLTTRFAALGITHWTKVRTLDDAAYARDEMFVEVDQEPWGPMLEPRRSLLIAMYPLPAVTGAPAQVGKDTDAVLAKLGLSKPEVRALRLAGALRAVPDIQVLAMNV